MKSTNFTSKSGKMTNINTQKLQFRVKKSYLLENEEHETGVILGEQSLHSECCQRLEQRVTSDQSWGHEKKDQPTTSGLVSTARQYDHC